MFKKLAEKLKTETWDKPFSPVTSPLKDNEALKNMSKHALGLYERQTDINNFVKLTLSDPENESHNQLAAELFENNNVFNPFSEDALLELSENTKFLHDLGLD